MPKLNLRTCLVCQTIRPKSQMIRLSLFKDHQVLLDKQQNLKGRGAYICNDLCLKKLQKEPARLSRAFRQKVTLPPDLQL